MCYTQDTGQRPPEPLYSELPTSIAYPWYKAGHICTAATSARQPHLHSSHICTAAAEVWIYQVLLLHGDSYVTDLILPSTASWRVNYKGLAFILTDPWIAHPPASLFSSEFPLLQVSICLQVGRQAKEPAHGPSCLGRFKSQPAGYRDGLYSGGLEAGGS